MDRVTYKIKDYEPSFYNDKLNVQNLIETVKEIGDLLTKNGKTISCAESCTGGLISKSFTDISGSSNFLEEVYVLMQQIQKYQF